jgi:addiction module RelE/StbE family toxin
MKISYTKNFIKKSQKLNIKSRQQLLEKIELFTQNPLHSSLRNHRLAGKYKDYRSINVTGDIRALYLQKDNEAIFDAIGTHSQLYG